MVLLSLGQQPDGSSLGIEGALDERRLGPDDGFLGLVDRFLDVDGGDEVDGGLSADVDGVDGRAADSFGDGNILLEDIAHLIRK